MLSNAKQLFFLVKWSENFVRCETKTFWMRNIFVSQKDGKCVCYWSCYCYLILLLLLDLVIDTWSCYFYLILLLLLDLVTCFIFNSNHNFFAIMAAPTAKNGGKHIISLGEVPINYFITCPQCNFQWQYAWFFTRNFSLFQNPPTPLPNIHENGEDQGHCAAEGGHLHE